MTLAVNDEVRVLVVVVLFVVVVAALVVVACVEVVDLVVVVVAVVVVVEVVVELVGALKYASTKLAEPALNLQVASVAQTGSQRANAEPEAASARRVTRDW